MSIRLLIADDQLVARLGLKGFLAGTEVKVVAEASSGKQAIELATKCKPDVVLMALRMPREDGLSALKRIKRKRPKLPVIITANQDHATYFAKAHALGASGFLLKDVRRKDLLAAGERFWTRTHLRRVTGVLTAPRLDLDTDAPLTPREADVLRGMAGGLTNLEIADQLGISYETVKEHVQHVLRKIGVDDRTQAAVWAVRNGLT